jgi:hypothetical protein
VRSERDLIMWCILNAASNIVVRSLRDRAIGGRIWTALAGPVAGAFIASVMAASMWRALSGRGQVWKGRVIR